MAETDEIEIAIRRLREEAETRWAAGDRARCAELQTSAAAVEAFYSALKRTIIEAAATHGTPLPPNLRS